MDERTFRLISEYLDGCGTLAEREHIELKLRNDYVFRQQYRVVSDFYQLLDAAKPALIQVPPDFRENVMNKVKAFIIRGAMEFPGSSWNMISMV